MPRTSANLGTQGLPPAALMAAPAAGLTYIYIYIYIHIHTHSTLNPKPQSLNRWSSYVRTTKRRRKERRVGGRGRAQRLSGCGVVGLKPGVEILGVWGFRV